MSYAPTTDFLALLRLLPGGVRTERMPGLDYIVAALARAGQFALSVGQTPPTANQATTAWFVPASSSWASEGTLFLWNAATGAYELATPTLWAAIFTASNAAQVTQTVTAPGPANVLTNANAVLVNQAASAPIALVMPLAANKIGPVLISDWKGDAGAGNTITVTLAGADTFPGGLTSWQIADNAGSLFLRPIPGVGYVL